MGVGAAIAAATLSAIGTGVSAYSSYQSGKAQQAAANYNAKLAENEALAAEQATRAETQRMRTQAKRTSASQRASYAKSGAVISEGTPLITMAEQAGEMELDILNTQRTGYNSAQASRNQAKLYKYTGKQAASAGTIGAGASLLTGSANTISQYNMLQDK